MATKLKSFKGKTRRKTGFVDLGDDIIIPIRTLSITEDKEIKLSSSIAIPRKVRPATSEEKENLFKFDPQYNPKTYPMICEYDVESEEYQDRFEKKDKMQRMMHVIKYIDMDYVVDEETGATLWNDLGIARGNWEGVCEYFGDTLCLTENDMSKIFVEVKRIQKDSVFEQLDKLSKLSAKYSPFDILNLLEKVKIEEDIESRYAEKLLENNEEINETEE